MLKIFYLCDRDYYQEKMSRVRFHSMEAISKREDVDLVMTGPNWPEYDVKKTVLENIQNIYEHTPHEKPDIIVAYKPIDYRLRGLFDRYKTEEDTLDGIPVCIRYNEMYDVSYTTREIMQAQANLIVCHHENDCDSYNKMFDKFDLFKPHFVNVPHCAEKTIFKDYGVEKEFDLMLVGAVHGQSTMGHHYPLRDRMLSLLQKMSKKYNVGIAQHPGYDLLDAHTNKYAIDFAKAINSTKIAVTCSGVPRSRYGKYIEVPMCATALAADMPGEQQERIKEFLIEIDMGMTDSEIVNKLGFYIENDKERSELIQNGLEYSKDYTQEKYAETFVQVVREFLSNEKS